MNGCARFPRLSSGAFRRLDTKRAMPQRSGCEWNARNEFKNRNNKTEARVKQTRVWLVIWSTLSTPPQRGCKARNLDFMMRLGWCATRRARVTQIDKMNDFVAAFRFQPVLALFQHVRARAGDLANV